MKFLLDQDVYKCTADFLMSLGHDVIKVNDIGMGRSSDFAILKKAKLLSRILVSRDKDFGSLVFLDKELSGGIIFLRINPSEIKDVHSVLKILLEHYQEDDLRYSFCTITSKGYRIRKLSI